MLEAGSRYKQLINKDMIMTNNDNDDQNYLNQDQGHDVDNQEIIQQNEQVADNDSVRAQSQVHYNLNPSKDAQSCHSQLKIRKVRQNELGLPQSAFNGNQKQVHFDDNTRLQSETLNSKKIKKNNTKRRLKIQNQYQSLVTKVDQQEMSRYNSEFNFSSEDEKAGDDNNNQVNEQVQDENSQKVQNKSLKQNVSESANYLWKLLAMYWIPFLLSFLVIFVLTVIQMNFEIDSKCILEELGKKKKDRKLGKKCPLDSYAIINLINSFRHISFYALEFLLSMNIFQFSRRLLIQYMFTFLSLAVIIYKTIMQTLNEQKLVGVFSIVLIVIIVIFLLTSKHNAGILFWRGTQAICYILIIMIMIVLNSSVRDNRNFYASMMFQYATFINKKVSQIFLYYRIKNNLQYDDITVIYIGTIALEYIFIFDYVLIQNNNLSFRQFVAIFNFVVIQVQNITDVSIFYLVYSYFKKKNFFMLKNLVAAKYFVLIIATGYYYFYALISDLYLIILMGISLKIAQKLATTDNEIAIQRQLIAATANKYFEQKIEQSEITEYTIQQSVLGFYHFFLYQIVLIMIKAAFSENDRISNQYQLVYQIKQINNNLSLTNVIIFNIIIVLLVFSLVMIRSKKGLRIVKQANLYQVNPLQLILTCGIMSIISKGLFATIHMRLKISLS